MDTCNFEKLVVCQEIHIVLMVEMQRYKSLPTSRNKYREEPSRRFTFTEVRKLLMGDVTFLHKVFLFLEHWGLVNYGTTPPSFDANVEDVEEEHCKVHFEEGAPSRIQVAATPNSLKPICIKKLFFKTMKTNKYIRKRSKQLHLRFCLQIFFPSIVYCSGGIPVPPKHP
ncbi:hypothetical protein JHK86_001111 [Glycine max]|nr:hypothetical protein JHK86_001111 [Glycine max]